MTNSNSNALNLLAIYDSGSDSESDVPGPRVSVKRCFKEEDDNRKSQKFLRNVESVKLPLPSILQPESKSDEREQNEAHGGKIRTFPHERGNWSTYVFIPYETNDIMTELISDLISKCKSCVSLQPNEDLHISLTKTVVLKHHWIDSFVKTLSENLTQLPWFLILFDKLKVYCNEERTRTFLSLQIKSGHDSLTHIVKILDQCLGEYNLPEFYKDPSFHMSVAWCVGDYEAALNKLLDNLNEIVVEYMINYPQCNWYIHVKKLFCKTGNKMFNFNLSPVGHKVMS